jgi:hypothetical protein
MFRHGFIPQLARELALLFLNIIHDRICINYTITVQSGLQHVLYLLQWLINTFIQPHKSNGVLEERHRSPAGLFMRFLRVVW